MYMYVYMCVYVIFLKYFIRNIFALRKTIVHLIHHKLTLPPNPHTQVRVNNRCDESQGARGKSINNSLSIQSD